MSYRECREPLFITRLALQCNVCNMCTRENWAGVSHDGRGNHQGSDCAEAVLSWLGCARRTTVRSACDDGQVSLFSCRWCMVQAGQCMCWQAPEPCVFLFPLLGHLLQTLPP